VSTFYAKGDGVWFPGRANPALRGEKRFLTDGALQEKESSSEKVPVEMLTGGVFFWT